MRTPAIAMYVLGAADPRVPASNRCLSRCKTRMIRKRRHGSGAVVKQQEEGRVGAWRSLVAHLHGVQGVPSSNLGAPTSLKSVFRLRRLVLFLVPLGRIAK